LTRTDDSGFPARQRRWANGIPGKIARNVDVVSLNNWKADYEQFLQ